MNRAISTLMDETMKRMFVVIFLGLWIALGSSFSYADQRPSNHIISCYGRAYGSPSSSKVCCAGYGILNIYKQERSVLIVLFIYTPKMGQWEMAKKLHLIRGATTI